jgi:hypothetical protein
MAPLHVPVEFVTSCEGRLTTKNAALVLPDCRVRAGSGHVPLKQLRGGVGLVAGLACEVILHSGVDISVQDRIESATGFILTEGVA